MEYYVTVRKNKLEIHDSKWMDLENVCWMKLIFETSCLSEDEDVCKKKILLRRDTKIIILNLQYFSS